MSLTDPASDCSSVSADFFLEKLREAKTARVEAGAGPSVMYRGDNPSPLVWFDQAFGIKLDPVGTFTCPLALRVGATQSSLDVVVVANHQNEDNLTVPAGTTITVTLLQSDTADGMFEASGASMTMTVPDDGMMVEADSQVARFYVGNMTKAWAKVKVKIEGAITGGTIDVGLAYMPR